MTQIKLTANEKYALEVLHRSGDVYCFDLPEKTLKDCMDTVILGINTYEKLVKKGLAFFTEEDLIDPNNPEMGTWTPSIYLTDEGAALAKELFNVKSN